MNSRNDYRGLRFERPNGWLPRSLVPLGITMIAFIIVWRTVSGNALFWLLLITLAILVWVASYGWRTALAAVIEFLNNLERM
ncbi:MAG: hypothetical protein IH859_00175 [Chloroflexi bacterium]|nr:hypothetical protein [Chloroflexota bacterium]